MFTTDARARINNNYSTTFKMGEPQPAQHYDFHSMENRTKQFKDTPLQPGATRQSYQDSDIFGTKAGSETVQASAYANREVKTRVTNTYQSNVMTAHDPLQPLDVNHVTRDEAKWQSNVFGEAIQEPCNRKRLNQNDQGREGIFGNNGLAD